MPRLESSIQRSVVEYAKKKGAVAIKLTTLGRFGTTGWPDFLFLFPKAKILFIEFKRHGGRLTPLQESKHEELRRRGIPVLVCDDAVRGKEAVDAMVAA